MSNDREYIVRQFEKSLSSDVKRILSNQGKLFDKVDAVKVDTAINTTEIKNIHAKIKAINGVKVDCGIRFETLDKKVNKNTNQINWIKGVGTAIAAFLGFK
jgi:hypothetical protein